MHEADGCEFTKKQEALKYAKSGVYHCRYIVLNLSAKLLCILHLILISEADTAPSRNRSIIDPSKTSEV